MQDRKIALDRSVTLCYTLIMNKKMPGVPESAQSEESARAFVESIIWPNGPYCPHCKATDLLGTRPPKK